MGDATHRCEIDMPKRSEQEWTPVYERNSGLWYVCDPQEPVIDFGFNEHEARAIADAHNEGGRRAR